MELRRSFGQGWDHLQKVTSNAGQNRVQFSVTLTAISDEIATLMKDTERSRKQLKDAGAKYQRQLREAESQLEKTKTKYEGLSEDLDRGRLQKQMQLRDAHFEDLTSSTKRMTISRGLFNKKVTEDDLEHRVRVAHDHYQLQIATTNQQRQEYYSKQLPVLLKVSLLLILRIFISL